jgi:hypothetical protein
LLEVPGTGENGKAMKREMSAEDRAIMGTPREAHLDLIEKARAWRDLRQPLIATAKLQRERDQLERRARLELANAALLWLWHQEDNPT